MPSPGAPLLAVGFRHPWGQAKPKKLAGTAETVPAALYSRVEPLLQLGLPFVQTAVSQDSFDWPSLPELFPASFPGVNRERDILGRPLTADEVQYFTDTARRVVAILLLTSDPVPHPMTLLELAKEQS